MEIVIAFALFVILTFGALWAGRLLDSGRLKEVLGQARRNWVTIAAAGFLLFVLAVSPTFFLAAAGFFVLVLFARSWSHEFLYLMKLEDSDFPGRFDKLVWAFLMIAMAPVGLWMFRGYRFSRWPEPAADHGKKANVVSDFI